ncbi:MAG: hypothetical protein ACJZ0Y_03550 [Cytophagales bacterium]
MIIKSITNSNIFNFYSDVTLEFDKGLNLILAENNQGKSQLFNSFNFGFFNRFFTEEDVNDNDNEKKIKSLNDDYEEYGEQLINRRFKKECKSGKNMCGTSIIFFITNESKKTDIEYTLSRNIWFEKDSNNNIEINEIQIKLDVNDEGNWDKSVKGDAAEAEISKILPQKIQDYIWLKGESLDDLINFKSGNKFKEVVKTISHYPILLEIEKRASKLLDHGNKLYEQQSRKYSSKKTKLQTIIRESGVKERDLEMTKVKLEKEEEKLRQISNEKEYASQKVREGFEDNQKRKEYDDLNNDLKQIISRINDLEDQKQKIINNTLLMSFGVQKYYDKGIDLLNKYDEKAAYPDEDEIEMTSSKIEWKTPGLDILNHIIKNETCELCQGPVKKGTKQWNEINARIKKQQLPKDKTGDPQFILATMKEQFKYNLTSNSNSLRNRIDSTRGEIDEIEEKFEKLNKLRIVKKDQIDKVSSKLSDRILENDDLIDHHNKLKDKEEYLANTKRRLEKTVEYYLSKIKELEIELKNLKENRKKEESKNEVNTKEIKIFPYLEFFKSISKELKEREEKKLFEELEKEANINYKNSLKHRGDVNQGGSLTLNQETGIIENIIEVDGVKEVRNGNKSNLVLMKLSIIESLIKFYSSNLGKKYPFIGDNFQASFDESTELAHLNKLNETFDQAIIIAKDHKHLRDLKGKKNVNIDIMKWDPPIEDQGVTTITRL